MVRAPAVMPRVHSQVKVQHRLLPQGLGSASEYRDASQAPHWPQDSKGVWAPSCLWPAASGPDGLPSLGLFILPPFPLACFLF